MSPHLVIFEGKPVAARHALREARTKAGRYQHQLALDIGYGHDSVRKWERGTQDPSTEKWIKAMAALGYRVVLEKQR